MTEERVGFDGRPMHLQPEDVRGGCAICRRDHRGYWSSHGPKHPKHTANVAVARSAIVSRKATGRVGFAAREEAHLARTARQTERMRELYEEAVRIEEAERVAREMGRIPRGQVLHDG